MDCAIAKYMRMGTVHFMSYPGVLTDETQIIPTLKKLIADPYFSVLEVARVKNPEIRAEVTKLFKHSDCTLILAAQPEQLGKKLNPNSLDKAEREFAIRQLKGMIDEAYEMGAKGMGIIAGKYEPEHKREAFELFVAACKELCDYAAAQGSLQLEVEQFDYDFHNKLLIGSAQTAKELAEEMKDYDHFGLVVDLSHLPLVRETPEECLKTLGKSVTHVHIGNAVCSKPDDYLYGDFHPRFSLENSAVGVDQVREFLKALFDYGYFDKEERPIVSFEIKAWQDDDPEAVIAECKRVMEHAWATL